MLRESNAAFAAGVVWDELNKSYRVNGQLVTNRVLGGAADAVVREIQARISTISDSLQLGKITLNEWYTQMQQYTKMLAGAESALAKGGWDNMSPKDWQRASEVALQQWEGVEDQFPGLRRFAEDIQNGRYTDKTTGELTSGVLHRANMYSDAGHGIYINARTRDHIESGYVAAERELANIDHCPDCLEWSEMGKISIEDMEDMYAIGMSVCGSNCHCDIFYYMLEDLDEDERARLEL